MVNYTLLDLEGNSIASYRYTAFGEREIFGGEDTPRSTSAIGNPWQYSEKRYDEESGLLAFGLRYYDPKLGLEVATIGAAGYSLAKAGVKAGSVAYRSLNTVKKATPFQRSLAAATESVDLTGLARTTSTSVENVQIYSLDMLSRAASVLDRNGLTVAGRSLTKHGVGARPTNSLFPAAKGNPQKINLQAQNLVDDILTTPGSRTVQNYRGRFGYTIEVNSPDGRGLVYDINGNFLFFKE